MASSSSSSPEISTAPPATGSQSTVQYSHLSREEVLEELSSRFILNLPEEELASLERVCFQVEQAHWYYEDFIREQNPTKFHSYTLKTFSEALFRASPPLQHWAHDHERAFASFMQYKTRVPVCGAIMLNDTWEKCVLVKGWKSSAGWGFPKGKINEQEPRPRCAAREVLEETGYDLEGQIAPEDVIELSIKEQSISLYIVPGVPEDYPFKTRTRKEISKIAWFKLSDLPTWKRSKAVPGKFYLISPFIGPLKAFINSRKPRNLQRRTRRSQSVQLHQEIHLSSEEDGSAFDTCPTVINDSNAQESSSQSSSADNGEPQTPSPQYSASHLSLQAPPQLLHADDEVGSALNLSGVDPHFARLLNSLSLSASGATINGDGKSDLSLQQKSHLSISSINSTTSATPNSMRVAHDVQNRPGSTDWSINVPETHASALSSSTQLDTSSAQHPSRSATTTPMLPAVQPTPSLSANTHCDGSSRSRQTPPSYSVPPVASTQTVGDTALVKQSPGLSRARHGPRASADISPYLSRPRDISKEMKYISMLENVVKESDKISHQRTQGPPQPQYSQIFQSETTSRAPGPSASVPPSSAYGRVESPVIYSSGSVAATAHSSAAPHVSQRMLPFDPTPFDDPFTVRPRTSAAFHPMPYPPPPHQANLGVENLRFMASGADPRNHIQPRLHAMGNHPPQMIVAPLGQPMFPPRPFSMMNGQQGGPPLRVVPPPFPASRYGQPPPLSAPAISPSSTFLPPANVTQPANNAHLLSILNTPSTAPRTVPVQTGIMNGMGPR